MVWTCLWCGLAFGVDLFMVEMICSHDRRLGGSLKSFQVRFILLIVVIINLRNVVGDKESYSSIITLLYNN